MEQSNVFEFDDFQIERESFLGSDCYGVVTSCKKDGEGIPYHLEVEFDISKARFSFSKCYAHEVVPCDELSAGGKLSVDGTIDRDEITILQIFSEGNRDNDGQFLYLRLILQTIIGKVPKDLVGFDVDASETDHGHVDFLMRQEILEDIQQLCRLVVAVWNDSFWVVLRHSLLFFK